ncbi:hypothetical protein Rhopal_002000-T1 [Rhodotorula paludigena]|uniref:Major facilitator superfamily (MFS) profile domain-containing protein n=1 Tax=Rhodotorula paludigena TaxID=86838 RepID=A0AAV5G8X5_9BASI|nr:hypothetical protein Rhopal_002000-T1 [Rhodotorula paludigena]
MADIKATDLLNNTAASWWKDPCLRRNVLVAIVCYFGTFALGYDGSYMTGLQSMPSWNEFFDHPKGNKLGIISASSYLPTLVLSPVYPILCDRLGRRYSAIIGSVGIIIGAIIGALANGLAMLIVGRAIVGTAGFVMILGANLLVNEILHPRLRPIGSAFFLVFYYVGSMTSAWVTFGVIAGEWTDSWGWRLPTMLQAIGPAVITVGMWFCPESPRWLVAVGRREQAHRVLANQHANGKMDDALVLRQLQDIDEAIERERGEKLGLRSFLKTPGNRHRLIILLCTSVGAQLNGASVFSYYLAPVLRLVGVTDPKEQTAINGGLAIWNLIASSTGAIIVDKIGRRKLWLTSTIGMLLAFACLTGLSAGFESTKRESVGLSTVAFIFIAYGAYSLGWTPLYFLFIGTLSILLVLIWFKFVETRGLSLEEIPALFDGPKALATPQRGSYVQEDDEHKDGKAASEEHLEVARRSV